MTDGLSILLVEDDADTCENLRDILELDQHRVSIVGLASEALQAAAKEASDVVILDRKLPDGNAETLLPQLREIMPAAEFIVATGYGDLDSTIAALRFGVADYILKPIHPEALRKALDHILERRRMERELRREHEFADRVISTAEAVVLILDLQGRIVRFNPFFERISGWSLPELEGQDWFDNCIPASHREWVREIFQRTASTSETVGVVNPILTHDQQERQIRWSNATLKDETGKTDSVLSIGLDITDLILAQQRALQTQRLAGIGQTMTALAHESRNALQRIQAGIEMLELEIDASSEAFTDLRSISRATHDLHELLEEVRSFAAPIILHREKAALKNFSQRVWRNLEWVRKDRDVQLIECCECPDESASLDVLRIEQVLRNLFENSLAACPDPVRIEVQFAMAEDETLEITVADNGPGLNAEQRSRLFEPFYTTKPTGTGLGMAIVHRIIDAHGGTIAAEHHQGNGKPQGARFRIRLPQRPS